MPLTPEQRFWAKVRKAGPDDCWEWTACRSPRGYGKFLSQAWPGEQQAHRVAWLITRGPIPDETPHVLHHCDNPPCVNPVHLWLGTHQDNMDDMIRKGRHRLRGRAILSDNDIPLIRAMFERHENSGTRAQKDIGLLMGVNFYVIREIVNGKNWRHVL